MDQSISLFTVTPKNQQWREGTGPYVREGIPPLNTALCILSIPLSLH